MRLVLASTSPYRRALLDRLRVPFEQRAPEVDEDAVKSRGLEPRAIAETLARAKAEAALAAALEDGPGPVLSIGSDQVCALDGRVLDKPGTPERAFEQLSSMRGRTHELVTAVHLAVGEGEPWSHTDIARLTLRELDDAALERYVAADRPLDCAGSYKLESLGIALFERVECADHTAIVGLPLVALARELARRGFRIP